MPTSFHLDSLVARAHDPPTQQTPRITHVGLTLWLMEYRPDDVAWLLREWVDSTKGGGEYMTWRRLVGRYPGRSDLAWLWGLVDSAVDDGYLTMTPEGKPSPDPDSQVTWDRWQLTKKGRALVGDDPQG